jgi:hypothetical protein
MALLSVACKKQWFLTPWVVVKANNKSFASILATTLVSSKDGDLELLRVALEGPLQDEELPSEEEVLVENGSSLHGKFNKTIAKKEVGDGLEILGMVEEEARMAIQDLLEGSEESIVSISIPQKISFVILYSSHTIYKSTLISQLNCNPFFSKHRLTRIKNSIYHNNNDYYVSIAEITNTYMLGLWLDCVVHFI